MIILLFYKNDDLVITYFHSLQIALPFFYRIKFTLYSHFASQTKTSRSESLFLKFTFICVKLKHATNV